MPRNELDALPNAQPYLLLTSSLELGGGCERDVFVCINLLEPMLTGVGLTREAAIAAMSANIADKYEDEGWREAERLG